ncbi:hypothetical protein [Reyranella sp.]|jgi:hypothetical protein|uniref:hypothetical protein n=1 Tax=Reyranella sp. TaxID=1929291 RepID=UPI000BD51E6D|nr:hypothetical protein [Reyranella sp.]OYY35595.1 MAG: hypothetical protein B7Y57_25790 [Rhodospirillales bacterium 35-66-84]OYZ91465.1 MAG: hypothetical protein B7Y08_25660 [Rhodospirillales bacterium 24-66-33]OZB22002.1 MAG: hypothetical protein B7X63_24585 [Rhodospirillales bacterium 39-66-50]HQS14979.1 hypothetical protein [Reyranella sp.]HQT10788.1 hypothetical protein [Reyranella sp.]
MTPDRDLIAETQTLFLARLNASHPVAAEALRPDIRRLCRSKNAAIACEAGRMFGALERRRLGCGDSA